jgi:hypothetical protein
VAIVTNTKLTYSTVGIREQLSDVISNISPTETPFLTSCGKGSAENTLFEWQTDALATADGANAQLEADDIASYQAPSETTRVANYQQISRKTAIVGGTVEAVKRAGRKGEMAYQLSKRAKELKRDQETILLQNQAAVAGASGTARKTGSLAAWVRTNVDKAGDGANPDAPAPTPTDNRTDGTTRAFTETILKNVAQLMFTTGASVDGSVLMVGPAQKQVVSGFSGIATKTLQRSETAPTAIIGAADVYVTDFGVIKVVPNRFQRNRDAWFLDFEFLEVAYLRPYQTEELAKTGDAEKRMILCEYGLKVKNEGALGLAADLS